ncbi:MAG: DUF2793 domain-containing protein [Sphingomonas sp.]|uniref:DUF2793 domain-containing protein n=1 Tax=Sphingomonas sp. TaxID=28214 RepID=UPI001AC1C683|nr:DUF2793 domain-containing protein [Sphingomonas sp.]MBN8808754.1 DUF2793 domain-containing protein [Sphingomonas sp.]
MTHNEAIVVLDLLVQPSVVALGTDTPPAAPVVGQCWIVGAGPTGVWAGMPHRLAGWTDGGWRFVDPVEGMAAWVAGTNFLARYVGGAWRPATAIAAPSGGATVDAEARAAIAAMLGMLRDQGLAIS